MNYDRRMSLNGNAPENNVMFYDGIAERYDTLHNAYDIERRLETVAGDTTLSGRLVLDAGCGTGHFSRHLSALGARVISFDISPKMLRITQERSGTRAVCGDVTRLPFRSSSFDGVVSSEVIEHTENPALAVRECARLLKMGGRLRLSTPNRFWFFSLAVARLLGVREFDGIENWSSWNDLRRFVAAAGLEPVDHFGVHFFPFHLSFLHPLLRRLDALGRTCGRFFVNQVIVADRI